MNIHQRDVFTPTKHCEYNSTKSIVRSVVNCASGPKQVAARLGMKREQRVYELTDPDCDAQMSFDAVRRLTSPTNRAAAEDLAALAGCVLMPVVKTDEPVSELVADSVKEHAEFVCLILRPHADSATERLAKIRELDDAIRALAEVRAALVAE